MGDTTGGAVDKFRKCIAAVICSMLMLVPNGSPPPQTSHQVQYRDALLDLCLPKDSVRNKKRRKLYEFYFRCDLSSGTIWVYMQFKDMPTKEDLADTLSYLLLPSGIDVLPRGRWCSSMVS